VEDRHDRWFCTRREAAVAVCVIQDWVEEETERSTRIYDAVSARLATEQTPVPEGFIVHEAGWTGKGFRIIKIWETREQFDRYLSERVMPIVAEVGGANGKAPDIAAYELHGLVTRDGVIS
jgi:hypothetical protein